MTEITMTLPRAEHLRDVLKSGNAIVQLVRDMMDGEEYADSLYGAVLILQSASGQQHLLIFMQYGDVN